MSFKKNNYIVLKNVISKDVADMAYSYLLNKRKIARVLFDERFISPFTDYFGVWNDKQIPNTYSHYADIAMETLMLKCQPAMEKATGLKLYPAYTYARIYKKGDELKRHKDRFNCEISTTIFLGGDKWDIFLEPSGKEGKKGLRVSFELGDMLIYKGHELEHWREPFKGKECFQVFLHYNNIKTKNAKEHIFDKRAHVGLPSFFRK